jgi:hypothetical protein
MRKYALAAAVAAAILVVFLLVRGAGRRTESPPPAAAGGDAAAPHAGFQQPSAGAHGSGGAENPHGAAAGGAQGATPAGHEGIAAAMAVVKYPLTMERLRDYASAIKELRAAGEKDAGLMASLRAPKPAADQPAELAAWLEAIRPLKTILKRHRLSGMDLVLMPQVLVQGRTAYANSQNGVPVAVEETNQSCLALFKADPATMTSMMSAISQDLRAISGP